MIFAERHIYLKFTFSLLSLVLVSCGGERSLPKEKARAFDRSYTVETSEEPDHSGIPLFLFGQSSTPNSVVLPDPNEKAFLVRGINLGKRIVFEEPIELLNSSTGEKFFVWDEAYLDSSILHVGFTHSAKYYGKRQRSTTLQPKRDPDTKRFYIPISALFRKEKQPWLNEHYVQTISLVLEMADHSSHHFSIEFKVKESSSKQKGI